jgi:hypothetical protein
VPIKAQLPRFGCLYDTDEQRVAAVRRTGWVTSRPLKCASAQSGDCRWCDHIDCA